MHKLLCFRVHDPRHILLLTVHPALAIDERKPCSNLNGYTSRCPPDHVHGGMPREHEQSFTAARQQYFFTASTHCEVAVRSTESRDALMIVNFLEA